MVLDSAFCRYKLISLLVEGALFHQELRFNMSLSVSMSGLEWGRGAKGWSHWRELPAGGIRASQGTFSSFLLRRLILVFL